MKRLDLRNKRFGRLLVIEKTGKKKWGKILWKCQCDCGEEVIVSGCNLVGSRTRSCGCLRKEISRAMRLQERKTEKNNNFKILPRKVAAFNCLFSTYRVRARKTDKEFFLTKEQFKELTKQNCYYCGKKPSQIYKSSFYYKSKFCRNDGYIYNGVDRVDNTKDYTIDNCVSCCGLCNWMKRDLSQIEFLSHVDQIAKYNAVQQAEKVFKNHNS